MPVCIHIIKAAVISVLILIQFSCEENPTPVTAVIDRIENNEFAVILIEGSKEELVLPVKNLPCNCKEGLWLDLVMENNQYRVIAVNKEITKQNQMRGLILHEKNIKKSYFLKEGRK